MSARVLYSIILIILYVLPLSLCVSYIYIYSTHIGRSCEESTCDGIECHRYSSQLSSFLPYRLHGFTLNDDHTGKSLAIKASFSPVQISLSNMLQFVQYSMPATAVNRRAFAGKSSYDTTFYGDNQWHLFPVHSSLTPDYELDVNYLQVTSDVFVDYDIRVEVVDPYVFP